MSKEAVKDHFSTPSNAKSYFETELKGIKWNGNGQGMALCPFHEDHKQSLSIKDTGAFFCHGCGAKGGDVIAFHQLKYSLNFNEATKDLAEKAGITETKKRIVKTYDYTNEEGRLLYQVVRYEPKDFIQRRPDPDNSGNWIYNLQGVSLVPYNLPQLINGNYAFIVEGEKDCETLKGLGLIASCNAQGAGKWKESYNQYFKGKRVYIIPDNDKPGKEHALQVARSLKGIASLVKIIELPDLPEKGDVTDWIEKGGTKERLGEIVKAAPEWTEVAKPKSPLDNSLIKWNSILTLTDNTEYLLDKLIPEGAITLLFGRGGIGKTSLALQLIHAIAEKKEFAGLKTKQSTVTYIDLENPMSVLKERITHIGGADNIWIWHGICEPSPPRLDRDDYIQYMDLPRGLIVFDTLRASFLGDENNSKDIAIIVDRLKQLRDNGFTILLLHHTPKSNDAIYKGSTAILDLVDHALCLEPVKDDDESIDFNPERIYRFGVKIKTRFEPHHIFLRFNPDIKGFEVAKDPDIELMERMRDVLIQGDKHLNQTEFQKAVREDLNISKNRIEKLIKKGSGQYWEVRNEIGKRGLIYKPKTISQFPNHIYSRKSGNALSEHDG